MSSSPEWLAANRDRLLAYGRTHRAKNKKALRARALQRKYGLTEWQFDLIAAWQDWSCAICLGKSRLCVDHDHQTGVVRGLLCDACNHMLGKAKDQPERLEAGARYLRGL